MSWGFAGLDPARTEEILTGQAKNLSCGMLDRLHAIRSPSGRRSALSRRGTGDAVCHLKIEQKIQEAEEALS